MDTSISNNISYIKQYIACILHIILINNFQFENCLSANVFNVYNYGDPANFTFYQIL